MQHALDFLLDQVRGAWRFRRIGMMLAWLVCVSGWLVVLALPDKYGAFARVYVDTRTRLSQLTRGIAVESNIGVEAEAVRQALLGAPQLEKVARLALPGFARASPEAQAGILEDLRKNLSVEASNQEEAERRGSPNDLYTITYTDRNRQTARHVVDQLLRLFLANSLGGTQESSEQSEQFLTQQIADYDKKLAAAENRVVDFKREHAGLVPGKSGDRQDYFARLHAYTDAVDKDRLALNIAEQKRDELRRQLSGELPVMGSSGNARGTDTATQLREAQARLDELTLRFTDRHPDVLAARRAIEELKEREKTELAAAQRGDQAAIAATGLAANPVFQGMKLQLSNIDLDIAAVRQQLADDERKIEEQRKLINTAPQVEAEYERLNRDYDVTHQEYQALVDRLSRAKLSDKADATGVVRFEVVDPPTAPTDPVSPQRPKLILAVLLAGLGAGLGVAWLMSQLRPVFTSPRQLTDVTNLPVLGSVSMTWVERHKAAGRRAVWAYSLAGALLLLLAIVTLLTTDVTSQLLHGLVA